MNNECPCRFCEKRHATCHGNCESYAEWSKINSEIRAKRHEATTNYYLSVTDRPKRRHGRK